MPVLAGRCSRLGRKEGGKLSLHLGQEVLEGKEPVLPDKGFLGWEQVSIGSSLMLISGQGAAEGM